MKFLRKYNLTYIIYLISNTIRICKITMKLTGVASRNMWLVIIGVGMISNAD